MFKQSIFFFGFCMLLLVVNTLDAQKANTSDYPFTGAEIKLGFYGETFTKPGLVFGYSKALRFKQIESELLSIRRETRFGGTLSVFNQTKNLTGYTLSGMLNFRKMNGSLEKPLSYRMFEYGLGLGVFYYDLQGESFEKEGEEFREVNGSGIAFSPSLAISYGRSLKMFGLPAMIYFSFNLSGEIPFRNIYLPRYAFELGTLYNLNKL